MRFASLGSGSKGNAWVVGRNPHPVADKSNPNINPVILVDCGFAYNRLSERLAVLNLTPEHIAAVLITHEHSDHIAGLSTLQKRHPHLPVWMSHGTALSLKNTNYRALADGDSLMVADINITAHTVPHDSAEPLQYRFSCAGKQMAIITDIGHAPRTLCDMVAGCSALALEFNHDVERLRKGDYPPSLKERIGGRYGHLSNHQSREVLIQWLKSSGGQPRTVVAAHLSEKTNEMAIVDNLLTDICDNIAPNLRHHIAHQNKPTEWIFVGDSNAQ